MKNETKPKQNKAKHNARQGQANQNNKQIKGKGGKNQNLKCLNVT